MNKSHPLWPAFIRWYTTDHVRRPLLDADGGRRMAEADWLEHGPLSQAFLAGHTTPAPAGWTAFAAESEERTNGTA